MVRIEGQRMGDGWEEFVKENELHIGEFLLFRYEGNRVFDVTVFQTAECERECHPPVDEGGPAMEEDCGTFESKESANISK